MTSRRATGSADPSPPAPVPPVTVKALPEDARRLIFDVVLTSAVVDAAVQQLPLKSVHPSIPEPVDEEARVERARHYESACASWLRWVPRYMVRTGVVTGAGSAIGVGGVAGAIEIGTVATAGGLGVGGLGALLILVQARKYAAVSQWQRKLRAGLDVVTQALEHRERTRERARDLLGSRYDVSVLVEDAFRLPMREVTRGAPMGYLANARRVGLLDYGRLGAPARPVAPAPVAGLLPRPASTLGGPGR